MFSQDTPVNPPVDPKTYPLGEKSEPVSFEHALALVALSHTPVEHRLYSAMLSVSPGPGQTPPTFTARRLITMTGIGSLSTIRRALEGLLVKLSIEREVGKNGNRKRENATAYRVFTPAEVIARRKEKGAMSRGPEPGQRTEAFARAVARVADNARLSRREAQVALCCVEGLTNAEIGKRLAVSEQTVKFHLRNVFLKSGVKRRAELIARLLM